MSQGVTITNNAHKDMPPVLYKFRDWSDEYHKKLLLNRELYFAKASQFNDPYDCSIPYRIRKEELTRGSIFNKYYNMAKKNNPNWSNAKLVEHANQWANKGLLTNEKHLSGLDKQIQKDIDKKFGIVSLSLKPDNILLWSHYSNSHKGFCVGFNTKHLYEFTQAALFSVNYQLSFPEYQLNNDSIEMIGTLLSTKSSLWGYENEYRLIKTEFAGRPLSLPLKVFENVIIGCKIPEDYKKEITAYIQENMKGVKLFRSFMCKTKFEIHFEQIL